MLNLSTDVKFSSACRSILAIQLHRSRGQAQQTIMLTIQSFYSALQCIQLGAFVDTQLLIDHTFIRKPIRFIFVQKKLVCDSSVISKCIELVYTLEMYLNFRVEQNPLMSFFKCYDEAMKVNGLKQKQTINSNTV